MGILRQAAVPHRYLARFVQQAHGVDHECGAQARHLPAVGNYADAFRFCLGIERLLLADHVGVTAQVAHTGPGLNGGAGDVQVVVVGHGTEESINSTQHVHHSGVVGDVHLSGFYDVVAQ